MVPLLVRIMLVLIRSVNTTVLSVFWYVVAKIMWQKLINPYVLGTLRNLVTRLGWFFPLLKS